MDIFEKDKIKYVNLMLSLILIGLMALFIIKPLISRVLADYEKYTITTSIRDRLKKNMLSVDVMRKVQADFEKQLSLISRALPANSDDGNFLTSLQSLALKNRLNLLKTNFDYNSSEKAIFFTLELDGKYDNFIKFLEDLNNLIRVTIVDNVDIKIDEDRVDGNIRSIIKGRIFRKAN